MDGEHLRQQRLDLIQGQHVGPIAEGMVWIGMDFEKQAIDAYGHRGPGQGGYELPLAAAAATPSPGLLDGVGGIKKNGAAQGPQLGQAAKINH